MLNLLSPWWKPIFMFWMMWFSLDFHSSSWFLTCLFHFYLTMTQLACRDARLSSWVQDQSSSQLLDLPPPRIGKWWGTLWPQHIRLIMSYIVLSIFIYPKPLCRISKSTCFWGHRVKTMAKPAEGLHALTCFEIWRKPEVHLDWKKTSHGFMDQDFIPIQNTGFLWILASLFHDPIASTGSTGSAHWQSSLQLVGEHHIASIRCDQMWSVDFLPWPPSSFKLNSGWVIKKISKTELPRSHWASYASLIFFGSKQCESFGWSGHQGAECCLAKGFPGPVPLCHPQPTEFGPFFVPKHSFFFGTGTHKRTVIIRYPIWICRTWIV